MGLLPPPPIRELQRSAQSMHKCFFRHLSRVVCWWMEVLLQQRTPDATAKVMNFANDGRNCASNNWLALLKVTPKWKFLLNQTSVKPTSNTKLILQTDDQGAWQSLTYQTLRTRLIQCIRSSILHVWMPINLHWWILCLIFSLFSVTFVDQTQQQAKFSVFNCFSLPHSCSIFSLPASCSSVETGDSFQSQSSISHRSKLDKWLQLNGSV